MITRIYVDNYRCFVSFEWRPVRIEPFPDSDGLTPAELVAGGWNHDDRRLP